MGLIMSKENVRSNMCVDEEKHTFCSLYGTELKQQNFTYFSYTLALVKWECLGKIGRERDRVGAYTIGAIWSLLFFLTAVVVVVFSYFPFE